MEYRVDWPWVAMGGRTATSGGEPTEKYLNNLNSNNDMRLTHSLMSSLPCHQSNSCRISKPQDSGQRTFLLERRLIGWPSDCYILKSYDSSCIVYHRIITSWLIIQLKANFLTNNKPSISDLQQQKLIFHPPGGQFHSMLAALLCFHIVFILGSGKAAPMGHHWFCSKINADMAEPQDAEFQL